LPLPAKAKDQRMLCWNHHRGAPGASWINIYEVLIFTNNFICICEDVSAASECINYRSIICDRDLPTIYWTIRGIPKVRVCSKVSIIMQRRHMNAADLSRWTDICRQVLGKALGIWLRIHEVQELENLLVKSPINRSVIFPIQQMRLPLVLSHSKSLLADEPPPQRDWRAEKFMSGQSKPWWRNKPRAYH
jgi:hypothetical protein